MGTAGSRKLTGEENACDILSIADTITILNKDSAGLFVPMVVNLNAKYKGNQVKSVFIKVYLDPETTGRYLNSEGDRMNVSAIQYEAKVYKFMRQNGVRYSDMFMRYFASGGTCSVSNILRALHSRGYEDDCVFLRLLLQNSEKLGSLVDLNMLKNSNEGIYVGVNVMGTIPKNQMDPRAMLAYHKKNGEHPNDIFYHFMTIISQVMFACIAMEELTLVHNDLHQGNIYLERLNDYVDMEFEMDDGKIITLMTKYKVKVYDFDRAYSPLIGPNQQLVPRPHGSLEFYSQTNVFHKNKDFLAFCVNFGYMMIGPKALYKSLNLLDMRKHLRTVGDMVSKGYGAWLLETIDIKDVKSKQMAFFKKEYTKKVQKLPGIKSLRDDYEGGYPKEFFATTNDLKTIAEKVVALSNTLIESYREYNDD
jgi:hypothetical protein